MNDPVADKRDALAKKILLAAIHGWSFGRLDAAKAARDCYALADEMLKEGERRAAMVPLSRAGNVSLSAAARVYLDDDGSTA